MRYVWSTLLVFVVCDGFDPLRAEGPLFQWTGVKEPARGPDLDEPLVTDRPDFTEASSTVGLGVFQLESGYTFIGNDDDGVRTSIHSAGEFLVRYGIVDDWLEFRASLNPLAQREEAAGIVSSTAGTTDLQLGFKAWLTAQDEWRPEMALIGRLGVPTGSNAFTSNEVQPSFVWLYSWDLNEDFALAGNTGFYRATDDTDHDFLLLTQSVSLGVSLTDNLGCYIEYFNLVPHSAIGVQPQHYLDGGFTYLLSKDIQLDIRAGHGLNHAADDFFAGVGLSFRIP